MCESHLKCQKVLPSSILAVEESGLHQRLFPPGSCRCAVNFNILPALTCLKQRRPPPRPPLPLRKHSRRGDLEARRFSCCPHHVPLFSFLVHFPLSSPPIRCHPTVPLGSPHECLQAPAAPLHLTPGHPPFLHLQPFLVRLLALSDASLHLTAPSLPGQDLYAGALCHQRVPRAHPPHPTDLRLLPPFPRLPMHTSTSEGEEDPEGGDFQWGDGWRVQGWGEEREQRRGQGGDARLR